MNAAARLFNQGVLSRGWAATVFFSKVKPSTIVLAIAVLTSALSVVYVTNTTRCVSATLQQTIYERDNYRVQWGRLLLEKSTWMMQARVQQVAEDELGMVTPDNKSVVIINADVAR
jgi:cell division protein FtsL